MALTTNAGTMVEMMEEAAAVAQCQYEAGSFSNAIAEFEQCQKLWDKQRHKFMPLNDGHQKHHDAGHQDDEIVMGDDDPIIIAPTRKILTKSVRVELIALPPHSRKKYLGNFPVALCT